MMNGLRLDLRPLMQMTLLPPSPAAGTRFGTIRASAPNMVSNTL